MRGHSTPLSADAEFVVVGGTNVDFTVDPPRTVGPEDVSTGIEIVHTPTDPPARRGGAKGYRNDTGRRAGRPQHGGGGSGGYRR